MTARKGERILSLDFEVIFKLLRESLKPNQRLVGLPNDTEVLCVEPTYGSCANLRVRSAEWEYQDPYVYVEVHEEAV